MGANRARSRILVTIALVALLAGSQALAAASASSDGMSVTGRVMGRTGFAYLGGLRTFAAAVLWNRVEPLYHGYYKDLPIEKQQYMVPTLYLVTVLDPNFVQAYYMSSFMVGRMVTPEKGIALAREGVRNNPESGLMHSNLAQLLFVEDKKAHKLEILKEIDSALAPSRVWLDDEERYDGYLKIVRMLEDLGREQDAKKVDAVMQRMREAGIGQGLEEDPSD